MLDADKAGRKAADAVVPTLAGEGMDAVRIGLPEGTIRTRSFVGWGERRLPLTSVRRCGRPGPSEEQVLLGRIRKGIGLLSGVAEAEKRERLLRVLEDCLTQLKGLVRRCLPSGDNGLEVGMTGTSDDEEGKWKNRSTTLRSWDGNIAQMSRPKWLLGA